jgi:hypothetical protein
MSKTIHIDDRPDWEFTEEEKRKKAEEAERILGPERCKQIEEEFDAWLKKYLEREKQEKQKKQ